MILNTNFTITAITKIEAEDSWIYESNEIQYYENVTEILLRENDDNVYSKIETSRTYPFAFYQFSKSFDNLFNAQFNVNVELGSGFLYLTQGGGFPVWHDYQITGGNVYFEMGNFTKELILDQNSEIIWTITGDLIENGLSILTRYEISQRILWAENQQLNYISSYLITSFQNDVYTVEYESLRIIFQVENADQSDQFVIDYSPISGSSRLFIRENTIQTTDIEGDEVTDPTLLENNLAFKMNFTNTYVIPESFEQRELDRDSFGTNNTSTKLSKYILDGQDQSSSISESNQETIIITETVTETETTSVNSPVNLTYNSIMICILVLSVKRSLFLRREPVK